MLSMEEELVNICRLCIEVCKNYDLIDVFSENGRSKELVDKIEKYLSLTITEDTHLSTTICLFCYNKLEEWSRFSEKVIENQQTFEDHQSIASPNVTLKDLICEETNLLYSENESDDCHVQPNLTINEVMVVESREEEEICIESSSTKPSIESFLLQYYPLTCQFCENDLEFLDIHEMHAHYLEEHHIAGYLECCNMYFTDWKVIEEHIDTHMDSPEIKEENLLIEKNKKKKKNKRLPGFTCRFCDKYFQSNKSLEIHVSGKHLGVKFNCYLCEKNYKYKTDLKLHMKNMHMDRKKETCEICGASVFDIKKHLQRHYERELNLKCDICGKSVPNQKCLDLHIKRIHSKIKDMYKCPECPKAFSSRLTLKNHESVHSGQMRYKCEYCDRPFSNTGNKSKHIKKMHSHEQRPR